MRKFFFLLFFISSYFIYGQTIITGLACDIDNKPIPEINVAVHEKGSNLMSGFAMTNEKGNYKLEYKGKSDSISITVSGFNIKKQTKVIVNRNREINFIIETESIVLNEVKIKPPKIRQTGDTLNYLVDAFSDTNDRTIGDVLKKMPGIEVKENGAILYQDRPINKFYIENADLLQGRYGIATNNIEAKDVSTVQVMENHQPIKALKDREFSEDAAINLKLKDSAKGVIIANAQVGIGMAPLLWNNELTGIYIAKKLQNITTYKGNNTGNNAAMELNQFYSGDGSRMGDNTLLNVQRPSTPNIREKRYLDNQANIASSNNLWNLKNDYQLTANINYMNDLQYKSSYAYTEYFLQEDSLLEIEEVLNSRLRTEKISADIQLNANKSKYYFNNLLKLEGIRDRERGDAFSEDSVYQHLKKPNYGINNTFHLVKTTDNHTWNLYSYNGYNTSNQTLSIRPVLYQQLFDPVQTQEMIIQDVELDKFASYNRVTLGFGKESFKQNYTLNFRTDIQNLESKLYTDANESRYNAPDSLRNKIRHNKFEWVFSPNYTYARGNKLNISLWLPLSYIILDRQDQVKDDKNNNTYLYFNPSFYLRYKLSAFWDSSVNYGYNNSMGTINNAYTGYIMSSYRNLLRNDGKLYKQQQQNAGISLSYRNPLTTLFSNVNISYFRNRENLLYDYYYSGILKVQSTVNLPNTTEGINIMGSLSKEIESLRSTLFLRGDYSNNKSSQINQGEIIDYTNKSFSLSPRIITKLNSMFSFEYQFNYSQNRSRIKNNDNIFKPIRITSQNVQVNIFPLKKLIINLKYENFYNNAITSGSRSMSFGDIVIKYKLKKVDLTLDYTNIFNTRQFVSASYSDVSRYYYSYDLRPAEVLLKVRFNLK